MSLWFCLVAFTSLISCPKEYLEAGEPRIDASLSPLSRNISLNSSTAKNWKCSGCHWSSPSENILILHQSVLIKTPLSLRLVGALNEKRLGLEILWQLIFLAKTATKTKNDTALISFSDNFKAVMRADNCRKGFPLFLEPELSVPAMEHWWQAKMKMSAKITTGLDPSWRGHWGFFIMCCLKHKFGTQWSCSPRLQQRLQNSQHLSWSVNIVLPEVLARSEKESQEAASAELQSNIACSIVACEHKMKRERGPQKAHWSRQVNYLQQMVSHRIIKSQRT